MGVEPIPPASQAGVPTAYTTDTIEPAEGRIELSLATEQLDQDSNPEHLVRSEG